VKIAAFHKRINTTENLRNYNPLKHSDVRWLHFEVFSAIAIQV